MEWFRVWHDYFDDPKFRRLTKAQKYDVLCLIRLASGNEPRGEIGLDDADIADYLDLEAEELSTLVRFLERKQVITRTAEGLLRFCHWEKRQPASDNTASRMQRFRERERQKQRAIRNGDVTVTDRTEQNRTEHNRAEQKAPGGATAPPAIPHSLDDPPIDAKLYRAQLKGHKATDDEIAYAESEMRRRNAGPRKWTAAYMWPIIRDLRETVEAAPPAVKPVDMNREDPSVAHARKLAREATT